MPICINITMTLNKHADSVENSSTVSDTLQINPSMVLLYATSFINFIFYKKQDDFVENVPIS